VRLAASSVKESVSARLKFAATVLSIVPVGVASPAPGAV